MMDTHDLALQLCPNAFNCLRMDVAYDVLATRMVNCRVRIFFA